MKTLNEFVLSFEFQDSDMDKKVKDRATLLAFDEWSSKREGRDNEVMYKGFKLTHPEIISDFLHQCDHWERGAYIWSSLEVLVVYKSATYILVSAEKRNAAWVLPTLLIKDYE